MTGQQKRQSPPLPGQLDAPRPPYKNPPAERALLGCFIINPEHLERLGGIIIVADYSDGRLEVWHKAIVATYRPGDMEIDQVLLHENLKRLGYAYGDAGEINEHELTESAETQHVWDYAQIVLENAIERRRLEVHRLGAAHTLGSREVTEALAACDERLAAFKRARAGEHTSKSREGDEDDESTSSTYADWPDPMREAAYIGPVGDFVRKLAPQTEAAPEGLLVQALVAAGNAMGRHGHYVVEADRHHTNLFAVMVGGTGTRKGVSWGHVRAFIRRADESWEQDHVINGLSTGEGLINAVKDDEPAIPDKVALAFESEFASVFKLKSREGNTLSTVLRQAWDGDTLRTLTKETPLRATGTHISIIGHITPEELRRVMGETDAGNGFANRILWVCVRRARYLPDGGEDVNLNDQVEALNKAIADAKTAGRLKRSDEATQLWHQRYRELSSGRPGLLGAVTNRAEAQVTRLSLIYALLDRSPVIEKGHLEAALAVWDYCLASASFIFGAALGDALAEKLDAELARHGAEGMSRTELYHFLSNNHGAKEIAAALGTLASQGRAEQRAVKGDAGRTTKRWYSLTYNVFNVNNGFSGTAAPAPDAVQNALNTSNTYYVGAVEGGDGAVASDALGVPARTSAAPMAAATAGEPGVWGAA